VRRTHGRSFEQRIRVRYCGRWFSETLGLPGIAVLAVANVFLVEDTISQNDT
jgi:hypothetical protein